MTWLLDFEGYSMRNAPAIRTSLQVLHTLQNHYPERLGSAVCYHAPALFSMTWKVRSVSEIVVVGAGLSRGQDACSFRWCQLVAVGSFCPSVVGFCDSLECIYTDGAVQ